MAAILPVNQPVLALQNPVPTANSSWLQTAAKVVTIVIGVLSSLASFYFLPAETAIIATGCIAAAATAIYACIKGCFPKAAPLPPALQLPVQLPPQVIVPPVIVQQPHRVVVPPRIPFQILPTPMSETVHPRQGRIQPVIPGRELTSVIQTQPGGRGPTTPVNRFAAFAKRVTDRAMPQIKFAPPLQPRATTPAETGRGSTIKPGMGSDQSVTGSTIHLGTTQERLVERGSTLAGRATVSTGGRGGAPTPQFIPSHTTPPATRPTPTIGSTIRPGAGNNQVASGPTITLGHRGK
jgi:hypothetical protein